MNITYKTLRVSELSEEVLSAASDLFSNHYGVYSGKDNPAKKGQRIKLAPRYYSRLGENENMLVSLAYSGDKLIGQCFFLRKDVGDGKICTWVIQLVVHRFYRKRHIATNLLHSAWGFSNYYAWGLATANALTMKTLEAVTWRQIEPSVILENISAIETLCTEVRFADANRIELSPEKSQIFTNFYPEADPHDASVYIAKLGKLQDGYEWLAFTFKSQDMYYREDRMEQMLNFSSDQLNEAYSRMDMRNQPWTRNTHVEISYIETACSLQPSQRVLDMGCGFGRHSLELASRGYNVVGVDMSEALLQQADSHKGALSVTFAKRDCRELTFRGSFDAIICLYDVIGSYRKLEDNKRIISSIYRKLRKGGMAVVSVMNMELTCSIATQRASVREVPSSLLKLKASNIMQTSGNVFNPDFFLLDEDSHLVYRKEQFEQDGQLSVEYVVADYRFTKAEISELFQEQGFQIIDARYVQAGHWDNPLSPTDTKAKEILLVLKK